MAATEKKTEQGQPMEAAEKKPEQGQPMEAAEKKPEQGQKMVKIKLFKGSGKYADDVFVGLNGETYKIQRGVEVEVPEGVAEILEHSAQQDALTSERLEKLAENAQHI